MIQSFSNTQNETSIGDFHLVIISGTTGKVEHWRRRNGDIRIQEPPNTDENNTGGSKKWELLEEAGGQDQVSSIWALVQGSFNGKMHMTTEQVDGGLALWEWDPLGEEGKRWNLVELLPHI